MRKVQNRVDDIFSRLEISSLEDLSDLKLLAYACNILVREAPLSGAEAWISFKDHPKKSVITVSNKIKHEGRKRFNIAHEIGHHELHRNSFLYSCCLDGDLRSFEATHSHKKGYDPEIEANEFASELLLPNRFVRPYFRGADGAFPFVIEMAHTFNVSLTAVGRKYVRINKRAMAFVFSTDNKIKWFDASKKFFEYKCFINVNKLVSSRSAAGNLFAGKAVSPDWRNVKSGDWLSSADFSLDDDILESSIIVKSYNTVLTLLYIG